MPRGPRGRDAGSRGTGRPPGGRVSTAGMLSPLPKKRVRDPSLPRRGLSCGAPPGPPGYGPQPWRSTLARQNRPRTGDRRAAGLCPGPRPSIPVRPGQRCTHTPSRARRRAGTGAGIRAGAGGRGELCYVVCSHRSVPFMLGRGVFAAPPAVCVSVWLPPCPHPWSARWCHKSAIAKVLTVPALLSRRRHGALMQGRDLRQHFQARQAQGSALPLPLAGRPTTPTCRGHDGRGALGVRHRQCLSVAKGHRCTGYPRLASSRGAGAPWSQSTR